MGGRIGSKWHRALNNIIRRSVIAGRPDNIWLAVCKSKAKRTDDDVLGHSDLWNVLSAMN